MKKIFLRVFRWVAMTFVFLLVLGVTGLVFYTHTDGFREAVRQKLLALINDSVRGKVSAARLDGSVWGSLTLIDVRLSDNGSEIIRVPRVKVIYSLPSLLLGRIQVFHLEAFEPMVWLKEGRDGAWNIVEALSPVAPQPETPSLVVSLNSVELQQADIDVSLSSSSYRLTGVNLEGTARIDSSGVSVDLRQVSSRLLTEGMPEARVKGGLGYQDTGALATLKFSDFLIEGGNSRFRLNGTVSDLKTFDTTGKVSIEQLAPADVRYFIPQWPVKQNISGTLNLSGPAHALNGDFSLSVADGSLSGKFQADVTQKTPVYQASAKIASLNLAKLLAREDLRGIVTGLVQANGSGFALADITVQAEANMRSAEITAWNLGDVFLKASLEHSEARMTGQFKSDLGHADWRGQIAFKDNPQFELDFSANQLDVQKLSPKGNAIQGKLSLDGFIKGSGVTLATMNAQTKLNLLPSTLGGVHLEQGKLAATLANQRIRVSEGWVKAADATFTVTGDIGTDLKQQGRLDYQLRVGTLSPWLALIDRTGSGSANLAGAARGNLDDLKAQGKIAVNSIDFEGTAVQRGTIDYDLAYSSARSLPSGTLNISLVEIRRSYRLQSLQGVVRILPQTPIALDVDAKARDTQSRTHTVAARLEYQPAHLVVRLARLALELPDGTWRLSQPAVVEQRDQDFIVDRLSMGNNGRLFFLDGRFSLGGSQALRLEIERLPIESFRIFFPEGPDVTGILSAQVQLGGTAAAPEIVATVKLDNSKISGQSYAGLAAVGSYRNQKAELKATVQQDPSHQLSASGSLPIILSWAGGWRVEASGNLEARIQSSGLSLAFLNAFSGKAIQAIDGEAEMDFQVRGPLSEPITTGFFRLRGGKLTPTALGIQVSPITAEGLLEPRGIRISQLSARANEGELNASGFIALTKFSPQAVNLSIAAKQWPAINTQQYQVELNGSANIDGTFAAPRITGKLEVPRGELRPDLSFLDRGSTPIKRDPTITVVSTKAAGVGSAVTQESDNPLENELLRNSSVDIQIRIPNNLWIRHRNGNAELSGNLRITKASGGKPALTGLIETIRGWVGFQGKRFILTRGECNSTAARQSIPRSTLWPNIGSTTIWSTSSLKGRRKNRH